MIIGAQLYTVRAFTQTEADFDSSMKKIREIGYSCVQVSGVGDIKAERLRAICDKYDLKIVPGQYTADFVAGGLGFIGYDGYFFADKQVH